MPTLNFSSKLKYTPVGLSGPVTIPFVIANNYNACNIGTLDVPVSTDSVIPVNVVVTEPSKDVISQPQKIEVPFGSVNSATGFYLKNNSGQELYVFINEVFSHSLANQGAILITMPSLPSTKVDPSLPLSSVTLYTSALQKKVGTVDYMVFGD